MSKIENKVKLDLRQWLADKKKIFVVKDLSLSYQFGKKPALKNINISIPEKTVTALIGPSGCGKSTFLRCFNKMNDFIEGAETEGSIIFEEKIELVNNIHTQEISVKKIFGKLKRSKDSQSVNPLELRTRVGMIFQKPNPFAMSIYDNVAFGPRASGIKRKEELDKIVKQSLEDSALWDEVKDHLNDTALGLSGGQQQRLCIARAIAMDPEVLLMDEPTSALDPIATKKIESLIKKLRDNYTIIIVTHSMQQAKRISKVTAFFYLGELIESGPTKIIFKEPEKQLTYDYIKGKMG